MTIIQLEYLVAIESQRSFAKAAKHCFVTQPTLSVQIKKLEDEIGFIIFNRTKKPVLTTNLGRILIAQAKIALSEIYKIKSVIESETNEIAGDFKLGIIPTLGSYLIPLFQAKFQENYPLVNLSIEEQSYEKILENFKFGNLDAAICAQQSFEKSINVHSLFHEKLILYASQDHPLLSQKKIEISDLKLEETWLLTEGDCFRKLIIALFKQPYKRNENRRFETINIETAKRIIDTTKGYTILPELASNYFLAEEKKRLRYFNTSDAERRIVLITKKVSFKQGVFEALKAVILSVLPEQMK